MDVQTARTLRIAVALGIAVFTVGGLYGWFVETPLPGVKLRIPLHGFADPGTAIWLLVLPAMVGLVAPLRGAWTIGLWFTGLPLVGLVLSAWAWGRGVIWNGGFAEAFSAGLIISSVGAAAVLLALSLAVALRD